MLSPLPIIAVVLPRMVFCGRKLRPHLLPLFMFPIYFTHVDAAPESVDMEGLLKAVEPPYGNSGDHRYRLEVYFLPGASEDDCIAHYHAEKATRGDYNVQIDALENPTTAVTTIDSPLLPDAPIPDGLGGSLPGMVPTYVAMGHWDRYDELLYMCPEKNWSDGAQVMKSVSFGFIGRERYEATIPMPDLESVPPKASDWYLINEDSPQYESSDNCAVSEEIFDTLHPHREGSNPYIMDAIKRGWVC